MPTFELNFGGQDKKTGKNLPPRILLSKFGPVIRVIVAPTKEHVEALTAKGEAAPQPVNGFALIDTGASTTAVDETICKSMGLSPTGVMKMGHADGASDRCCYAVQLIFPDMPIKPMMNPKTASVDLSAQKPISLLLGRDILQNMRLVYNGPMGRIEISV